MADAALLLTLEPATRLRASAAVLLGATELRGSEEKATGEDGNRDGFSEGLEMSLVGGRGACAG